MKQFEWMQNFLRQIHFTYIGDFMEKVNALIAVITAVVLLTLILNPNNIRSSSERIIFFIVGILVLLFGSTRTSKSSGSLVAVIVGAILMLYGLGYLNVP